ncbi:MAG TPA: endonuclease/exonuclease/phosphatase family protein [Pirellulaceae bacterium]|nr:endonuclease/exonuclease/phosphatase family protein [Pirellulaceae bacterium]HMO93827.1 endonuclease/exonuclease/phosphatase family protein [Pirellulaceae bacterium]HMP70686.1 endonuclease/exonuclease/phosphatase family protein [Pirellulaceae bacterium]
MRRFLVSTLMTACVLAAGWLLYHRDQISNPSDAIALAKHQFDLLRSSANSLANWDRPNRDVIRIASFNIQALGDKKLNQPEITAILGSIIREFDIVAIQEIRTRDQQLLARFTDEINSGGRRFQLVCSEAIGRTSYQERYAFLYDSQTIQLDGARTYTIDDPDDLLHREPLVGWFRTKLAPAQRAFTFTLVNLHLDSRSPQKEVVHLNQIFRVIRNDGRNEDDVIIVGDFNLSGNAMEGTTNRSGLVCLIENAPTNTRGTSQFDNIIIDPQATSEFTGRSGVYDFLKKFNLTIAEAIAVSDHLPVWAEFAVTEGHYQDLLASEDLQTPTSR